MSKVEVVKGRYGAVAVWENDVVITPAIKTYGEWFEREVEVFRLYCGSGNTVVDVGANIGTHTMALANIVGPAGRVVAIEPQRPMFMLMCANAVMNDYLQVEPHRAVAGTECRKMEYARANYSQPSSYGGFRCDVMQAMAVGRSDRDREALELITLDYLACHKASLIKIDVEGAEASVIAGAQNSIKLGAPVLYVENDRVEKSRDLIRLLRSLEYRLYWHIPLFFNPNNFAGSSTLIPIHQVGLFFDQGQYWVNGAAINMLCLPQGKELPLPQDVVEVGSDEEHPCLPAYRQRLLPDFKILGLTNGAAA